MKKYKVLWFDDECDELDYIPLSAEIHNIDIVSFSNAQEGIQELERDLLLYDAVIVDGNFYRKPGMSGDALNDSALLEVARTFDRLSERKLMPWFILSGQDSFKKGHNRYAAGYKDNKVYSKDEEALEDLWKDLISEADKQEETELKHTFSRVFETCSSKYIGEAAAEPLLTILKKENTLNAFTDSNLFFNPLRKIMEDFFSSINRYGLLPDAFVTGSTALNESSKYLSGISEKGLKLEISLFPKVISDNVKNILSVCQPASHRSEIDSFIKEVNSPYLLLSMTYQLLDTLLWFKKFIDKNPDPALNKINWKPTVIEESVIFEGTIGQDSDRNFYCGDYLLSYNFVNAHMKIGDLIRVVEASENSQARTSKIYPKFASKIIKI